MLHTNLKSKNNKFYKGSSIVNVSNLRIVSMIPGDRKVAGRLFHALSPRYDSSEECRVSYSFSIGGLI